MAPQDRSLVKTTRRSFQLLEYIMENNGASLSELSEAFDMAKSTIHNHIQTLLNLGYIIQRGSGYHLGSRFFILGEKARTRNPQLIAAQKHVYQLANTLDEEVTFCVEEHGELISLQHVVGDKPQMKYVRGQDNFLSGRIFNLHSTAAGKAILASYSDDQVQDIISARGLPSETPQTITDLDRLYDDLVEIREKGWASVDEEYQQGLRAIAGAVSEPGSGTLGAISISIPTYRTDMDSLNPYVTNLLDTIDDLESELRNMRDEHLNAR